MLIRRSLSSLPIPVVQGAGRAVVEVFSGVWGPIGLTSITDPCLAATGLGGREAGAGGSLVAGALVPEEDGGRGSWAEAGATRDNFRLGGAEGVLTEGEDF